jgi:hypothetical protein
MAMTNTYINLIYGFIAVVLLAGSFWIKSRSGGWLFYIVVLVGISISSLIIHSYFLAASGFLAGLISVFRFYQHGGKNRQIEVIFVNDHDDPYLRHFLEYYRADIFKYFPQFNFKIEDEFLVALLVSEMETVGLVIAEIKNADTLKICVDFLVPKHSRSQLAKTFYQCELRCIDFLGFRNIYIEPQSKVHNNYLERIGFRLVNGKYINQF